MNILLAGGTLTTGFLIKSLKSNGHEVMLVNQDHELCQLLADQYEVEAICGNGSDANILKAAHADKMDVVVALYDHDAINLIVSELAKKQFHVKHTFAMVNDPKNAGLFQGFGIDKCINVIRILSEFIEEQTIEENIKKYLPSKDNKVVIRDVVLSTNAPSLNKKLWEIGFPPQSIVAWILRAGDVIIPQGNTILMAGDKAIVISSSQSIDAALILLNGNKYKDHSAITPDIS